MLVLFNSQKKQYIFLNTPFVLRGSIITTLVGIILGMCNCDNCDKNNKMVSKTKVLLFILILIVTGILFSSFTNSIPAKEQTKTFCLDNIKQFQAQLDTLQKLAESKQNKEVLLQRFKATRIAFKRLEFVLEYMDGFHYPFFNGANAIDIDEQGYTENTKPEGLQVIESELFNDSLEYDRIIYLTKMLKYRALSFYIGFKEAVLQDSYILEAIRFNLIRIETLSLVSFDSPDIRNSNQEIIVSLNTLRTVLGYYKDEKSTDDIKALYKKIEEAIKYIKPTTFNSLDRLTFIKKYLQPITKDIISIQQKLNISYLGKDNSGIFRAVNIKSTSTIYDSNFLNLKFYAQDKYYKDNSLMAVIGKKLFFDKRLSIDGKLSCASCHLPDKSMGDGLPTSITNSPGVFQQRNTPSILNSALQAAYFHDLAATTLETQIVTVVNNPKEFNNSYDTIVNRLKLDTTYIRLFSQAFPTYKEEAISISTINLCIADYERKFIFLNSPFDKYMRNETKTMDASVKRGFNLFMGKAQCGSCHFAPTFFGTAPPFYGTTESEVLGIIKTFDTINPILDDDIGRYKHFALPDFKNSIKTATVRNIELTAPYMHHGGFKTLEEVVEFYNVGGGEGLGLSVPNQTLQPKRLNLSMQEKKDLIFFMKSLTDTSGMKSLL